MQAIGCAVAAVLASGLDRIDSGGRVGRTTFYTMHSRQLGRATFPAPTMCVESLPERRFRCLEIEAMFITIIT